MTDIVEELLEDARIAEGGEFPEDGCRWAITMREAAAEILRLRSLVEWREIDENTPRDGTLLQTWDGRSVSTSFWGRTDTVNPAGWCGGHCRINHIDQPTHWLPIPSPPLSIPKGGT